MGLINEIAQKQQRVITDVAQIETQEPCRFLLRLILTIFEFSTDVCENMAVEKKVD